MHPTLIGSVVTTLLILAGGYFAYRCFYCSKKVSRVERSLTCEP
jgi:hypothetical protein